MAYEDTNRAFVQAFFSRNVLTFEQARPILAAIFSVHEKKEVRVGDITQEDFASMISAANDALSPLDFEIRSAFHQDTRETYYALVNTTSDALTQVATIHTSDEIGYVKRLFDEMFDANNTERREAMCIAGKDALNLVRAGRRETQTQQNGESQTKFNLTAHEAEILLSKLVAEGWLEKSAKGFYSLSPRGLMELKGWLVETYNDEENDIRKIKSCEACKEIITVGQRCPNRDCPVRLHDICTQAFFRVQRNRICPTCKTEWDGKHYVGEKAITTSDSYLRGKRRSGAPARAEEEEEDDE
ncbi:hypothetical protein OHC33_001383 [Knufia fluminis]|uniref:Non-structural maintenance of chromosomes element 1 homolog n=1 Tax=Knufia fluminis TaxID=191047 RepID=A0AAN8EJ34_9EURO|nr:hypothetical protein OHC33_001383 [Knufia fluminis]